MRTIEFVYYLFCVGLLIAGLHHGDVRPSGEWFVLVIWPILIAVSVWFFGSYLQRGRGGLIVVQVGQLREVHGDLSCLVSGEEFRR